MKFIGDVHGKIDELALLVGDEPTFQVGDMGFGFGIHLPKWGNFRFIRGNHDDPAQAREHSSYAGDFGVDAFDDGRVFFYVGGAYSIDVAYRKQYEAIHGRAIWWPDEELSEEALQKAFELYVTTKPDVVASHDCPTSIGAMLLDKIVPGFRPEKKIVTRTGEALEHMWRAHQPKTWVFGHYHVDAQFEVEGTNFACLAELSAEEL